jgi:hypothetical protein
VTELEAAEKIAAVLNEVEAAGLQVTVDHNENIWVGDVQIAAPASEDEPWEVRA